MKSYKVVGTLVLLTAVSLTVFLTHGRHSSDIDTKGAVASNTSFPDRHDTVLVNASQHFSTEDLNDIMGEIDSRVKKINDGLNHELYKDHYDGDILMYHYFDRGVSEQDSYADYCLYYDEQGKLIYADISHYRGALYSIYFYNDELLHVEVGPFYEGGISIKGDMKNVKDVIKKDPSYEFVLEDSSLCLEQAYQ